MWAHVPFQGTDVSTLELKDKEIKVTCIIMNMNRQDMQIRSYQKI